MTNNTGGPAFPIPLNPGASYQGHAECDGMTMRDYFAAKAMQGWVSKGSFIYDSTHIAVAAQFAYKMADAMLKERSK